jgi:cytochrome c-type biogenesis protein CcmH/NrfF
VADLFQNMLHREARHCRACGKRFHVFRQGRTAEELRSPEIEQVEPVEVARAAAASAESGEDEPEKLRCPRCQSKDIAPSMPRGAGDDIQAFLGREPRHCRACGRRFHVRKEKPPAAAEAVEAGAAEAPTESGDGGPPEDGDATATDIPPSEPAAAEPKRSRCPRCYSIDLVLSNVRTTRDSLMGVLDFAPIRCRACGGRFYRFRGARRAGAPVVTEEGLPAETALNPPSGSSDDSGEPFDDLSGDLRCAGCYSKDVVRSSAKSLRDRVMGWSQRDPWRCRACGRRFYVVRETESEEGPLDAVAEAGAAEPMEELKPDAPPETPPGIEPKPGERRCPVCLSKDIVRSSPRGARDSWMARLHRRPLRCRACGQRFYVKDDSVPAGESAAVESAPPETKPRAGPGPVVAAEADPAAKKLRCPFCLSQDSTRSGAAGPLDGVMRWFRRAPRKCRSCGRRFYAAQGLFPREEPDKEDPIASPKPTRRALTKAAQERAEAIGMPRCPRCFSFDSASSPPNGPRDSLMRYMRRKPRHCRFCGKRYYVALERVRPGGPASGLEFPRVEETAGRAAKAAATLRCPRCSSKNIVYSVRRGPLDWSMGVFGMRPRRCRACRRRFYVSLAKLAYYIPPTPGSAPPGGEADSDGDE